MPAARPRNARGMPSQARPAPPPPPASRCYLVGQCPATDPCRERGFPPQCPVARRSAPLRCLVQSRSPLGAPERPHPTARRLPVFLPRSCSPAPPPRPAVPPSTPAPRCVVPPATGRRAGPSVQARHRVRTPSGASCTSWIPSVRSRSCAPTPRFWRRTSMPPLHRSLAPPLRIRAPLNAPCRQGRRRSPHAEE